MSTRTAGSELEVEIRMAVTLQDLEARLWGAANALRGPVDPADFKTYVFPMLFWKWISDNWDYEHTQALEEFGDELIDEIEADYHRFNVPLDCRWSEVTTKTDNLGHRVGRALGKLEQANAKTLAGIFGDAAWGNKERLPESALVGLVEAFNGLTLNPDNVSHDMLGQAYEYLLKQFADASGKKAGEFFTPRQVVHLLVGILDPQPEETICDPASGSGGMLVETINTVRAKGHDHRTLRLYAQEVNLTTAAIARMNLFLHEIEDFRVVRGDTLRNPGLRNRDGSLQQFDVVIANPPFSLQSWGAELWAADGRALCGIPPAKNGDYAWIQHMISTMRPDSGRVGVVMPLGALVRGGVEASIRKCLVQHDHLEAVIGLPGNLFYSTDIATCVLVFKASKRAERRGHVLFIDASARFQKAVNQNRLSETDIRDIIASYRNGSSAEPVHGIHARLVAVEEIEKNNYNLHIGRYVRSALAEGSNLEESLSAYAAARKERIEAERVMEQRLLAAGVCGPRQRRGPEGGTSWPARRVGDLVRQRKEAVVLEPGIEYRTMGVRWHGKGAYDRGLVTTETVKATRLFRARTGDFVFNRIDTHKGAFDVVLPTLEGALATNEFPLYETSTEELLVEFLLLHFQRPSVLKGIADLRAGSEGRARWKEVDFESHVIALPSLPEQRRIVSVMRGIREYLQSLGEGTAEGGELLAVRDLQTALLDALLSQDVHIPATYDRILNGVA